MKEPVNTWDQIDKGDVFISYYSPAPRDVGCNRWRVIGKGFDTDPGGHWQDHGSKAFLVDHPIREHKTAVLAEAMQWAEKRYGIKRWKANRMRDYIDADKGYAPLRKR